MVSAVKVVKYPSVEELKLLDFFLGFVDALGSFVEIEYNQILFV